MQLKVRCHSLPFNYSIVEFFKRAELPPSKNVDSAGCIHS